jgi:hypothetical protein
LQRHAAILADRKELRRIRLASVGVIEYVVHPPALAPHLAAQLRAQDCEASTSGGRLWAAHPTAADPTEERLLLGGLITAWRREQPDARVDPVDYDPFTVSP